MCPTAIGVEPLLGPGRGFGPSTRVAASNLSHLGLYQLTVPCGRRRWGLGSGHLPKFRPALPREARTLPRPGTW